MATTVNALATEVNLTLHAGNDVPVTVTVTGNDDVPVTLTTWTSEFHISYGVSPILVLLSTGEDAAIDHYPDTDAINVVVIHLDADDTKSLTGDFMHELKLINSDGDQVTAMYGRISFHATSDRGA